VARFPLPVLTGIGHTTNISVVDEVAFADRITPTDAADFLVEKIHEFDGLLETLGIRVQETYLDCVLNEQSRLQQYANLLKMHVSQKVQNEIYYLSGSAEQLKNYTNRLVREFEVQLITQSQKIGHYVKQLFTVEKERIHHFNKALKSVPLQMLNLNEMKLDRLETAAGHLNPVNILKRGFSITKINGKAIRNSENLNAGDLIKTTFYEGTIESEVKGN
jgi:exodeoxyribonuclease VII large subunit